MDNILKEIDLTEIPTILEQLKAVKEIYEILYDYEIKYNKELKQVEKKDSKIKRVLDIIKE